MPSDQEQRLRRGAIAAADPSVDNRRRDGQDLPVHVQHGRPAGQGEHLPLQQRAVTSVNDDNLLLRQNYTLELIEPGRTTQLVKGGRSLYVRMGTEKNNLR